MDEAAQNVECYENGITAKSLWNLKKKLCPQIRESPTARMDTNGKSDDAIKSLALKTYEKKLENRPMKDDLKHIKQAKKN